MGSSAMVSMKVLAVALLSLAFCAIQAFAMDTGDHTCPAGGKGCHGVAFVQQKKMMTKKTAADTAGSAKAGDGNVAEEDDDDEYYDHDDDGTSASSLAEFKSSLDTASFAKAGDGDVAEEDDDDDADDADDDALSSFEKSEQKGVPKKYTIGKFDVPLTECAEKCLSMENCKGFVYRPSRKTKCHLKDGTETIDWRWGGRADFYERKSAGSSASSLAEFKSSLDTAGAAKAGDGDVAEEDDDGEYHDHDDDALSSFEKSEQKGVPKKYTIGKFDVPLTECAEKCLSMENCK